VAGEKAAIAESDSFPVDRAGKAKKVSEPEDDEKTTKKEKRKRSQVLTPAEAKKAKKGSADVGDADRSNSEDGALEMGDRSKGSREGKEKKTRREKHHGDGVSTGTVKEEVVVHADGPEPADAAPPKKKKESKSNRNTTTGVEHPAPEASTGTANEKKRRKPRSEKGELRRKLREETREAKATKGNDEESPAGAATDEETRRTKPAISSERVIKGATSLQEEAQIMRERLGLVASTEAEAEEPTKVGAAAGGEDVALEKPSEDQKSSVSTASGFKFGFSVNPKVEAEMEARAARLTGMVRNKDGAIVSSTEQAAGDGRRVYVGGMPFSYDEETIREYWEYCGELEEVDLLTFPDTGNFRGIVFLTFKTKEGAAAALEYDSADCEGKTLKVKIAHARPAKASRAIEASKPRSGPAAKTPGYNVLYVGNLAFEASPQHVTEHFQNCKVTKVRIHTDKDTGQPKGYAHVHVEDEESMDAAIEYNQTELFGRRIKVMFAQPKST